MCVDFKVDEIFQIIQLNTIKNNIHYYTINFFVRKLLILVGLFQSSIVILINYRLLGVSTLFSLYKNL